MRKGLNTLIILVAWELWKHRNRCVFYRVPLRTQQVVQAVMEEATAWSMAGVSKLGSLLQLPLVHG